MDSLSSQVIVGILNNQMRMPANTVWLRDQNMLIPNDTQLYMAVGIVSAFTIGNVTSLVSNVSPERWDAAGAKWDQARQKWDDGAVLEVNELIQEEIVNVDLLSRSNAAILRNWEVVAAMQSFYAQQQMEANNFKIFRPRSFLNTSSAEGGSMLNRYTISFPCMVWYRKETQLLPPGDYYNDFNQRVDDATTIATGSPLIEFEINSGGIVP